MGVLWSSANALYKRHMRKPKNYLIKPDPLDPRLSERVTGVDQTGAKVETAVVEPAKAFLAFLTNAESRACFRTFGLD